MSSRPLLALKKASAKRPADISIVRMAATMKANQPKGDIGAVSKKPENVTSRTPATKMATPAPVMIMNFFIANGLLFHPAI